MPNVTKVRYVKNSNVVHSLLIFCVFTLSDAARACGFVTR